MRWQNFHHRQCNGLNLFLQGFPYRLFLLQTNLYQYPLAFVQVFYCNEQGAVHVCDDTVVGSAPQHFYQSALPAFHIQTAAVKNYWQA